MILGCLRFPWRNSSHALLYSISLDKIGKRELSKKALDEILAVQESHDMGGIYWLILYEHRQFLWKKASGRRL